MKVIVAFESDDGGIIPQSFDAPIPHIGASLNLFNNSQSIEYVVKDVSYSYDEDREIMFATVYCKKLQTRKRKKC